MAQNKCHRNSFKKILWEQEQPLKVLQNRWGLELNFETRTGMHKEKGERDLWGEKEERRWRDEKDIDGEAWLLQ